MLLNIELDLSVEEEKMNGKEGLKKSSEQFITLLIKQLLNLLMQIAAILQIKQLRLVNYLKIMELLTLKNRVLIGNPSKLKK